jgi:hypothetical protein
MTPYETYVLYNALKNHFNTDWYDFIRYQGKLKTSVDAFHSRNDKYYFEKLSNRKDIRDYLISNIIANPKIWVGDLVNNSTTEKIFTDWKKRTQSLGYIFEEDLKKCLTLLEENIIVKEHQHPYLLKMFYRKKVSLETLVILNDLLGFFKHWNKQLSEDPLWSDTHRLCVKYKPFLIYDTKRMKSIAYNVFEEHHSEVA